jgi:hypothetical protein
MTRKEEIISDLKDLRESIDIIDPEFKESVFERIQSLETELQTIESNEVATVDEEASFNADETLAMLSAFMKETPNSGVDSDQVNKLINEYFQNKKINLDDLSKDVIDEIKKNQTIILEFPNFGGVKVEVTKQEEQIPFFYDILDDVLAGNNVYLIGGAGLGKAQPLTSKILSNNGWITFADVKVGDKVFGEDGKLYEINGVYDRGVKPTYRVFMNDGSFAETCDEHLWKIYTRNDRGKKRKGKVLPLKEFMANIKTKTGLANAFIDVNKPIQFEAKKHIISPYLMGVILGDGCVTTETISITNPSQELFDSLEIHEDLQLNKVNCDDRCLTYSIARKSAKTANIFGEEIHTLGLAGHKSINKFIPKDYLYDSIENRTLLLQGLNDTDAYYGDFNFEFSTSSYQLSEDYCELVRSLGGTAKIKSRVPVYTHNGEKREGALNYRITCVFPDEIIPFSLGSKLEKYKKPTKYKVKRFIDEVYYIGEMPVRCISVTNPSHLYITDNYIVTHNTYLAELVTKKLKREYTVINCSQYTSPIEVIGGQSIEGYKDGKLIQAWRDGKILILDEMPRLDPNTAGLFNDALAKSSKTNQNPSINSANPDMPPIPRSNDFAVIATGNIYPNEAPPPEYRANNQQDLSLLDRFSGSVYKVMPSKALDEQFCRFQFLYDMLVGNYYEYMDAIKNKTTKPQAKGLRTVLKDLGLDELAVVSYRTLTAFRVAFEFQLVRKIAESEGAKILNEGKTLDKAFDSFMIAFNNDATQANIIKNTGLTTAFIQKEVSGCIKKVIDGKIVQTLTSVVSENASTQLEKYKQLFVADYFKVNA